MHSLVRMNIMRSSLTGKLLVYRKSPAVWAFGNANWPWAQWDTSHYNQILIVRKPVWGKWHKLKVASKTPVYFKGLREMHDNYCYLDYTLWRYLFRNNSCLMIYCFNINRKSTVGERWSECMYKTSLKSMIKVRKLGGSWLNQYVIFGI